MQKKSMYTDMAEVNIMDVLLNKADDMSNLYDHHIGLDTPFF
jgi:hypothetical protein